MNKLHHDLAEGILFTDMYQLTMGQLYFRHGLHERPARFDHYFRKYPNYGEHQAGYCVNAGMGWLLDWMEDLHFTDEDLDCLRSERNADGTPVFEADFLQYLKEQGDFRSLKISGIREGRVVHPGTPLTVVEGPLLMAQILETALLNVINFQTLIATKAARVRHSVGASMLMEFGLRRAHGLGGNQGARAALIGGCDFTSNTGMSYAMNMPPKGTHSHAMVQTWLALGMDELDAFRAYAELYPDNCLLLVDTIDTLGSGVPNAIKVFEELKAKGHRPIGIRLDSGDLAYLAIQARKMLDKAGFEDTSITLSNDLDELTIRQIHDQIRDEALRNHIDADRCIRQLSYGVGTKLITSSGQSALGGVYKLVALFDKGEWVPAIKLSNSLAKVPNPGQKKAWRIYDTRSYATADLVALADEDFSNSPCITMHHPSEKGVCRKIASNEISHIEPLIEPIYNCGHLCRPLPDLAELRSRCRSDIESLDPGVLRLRNPHVYHVSLTSKLLKMKSDLIKKFRGEDSEHDDIIFGEHFGD